MLPASGWNLSLDFKALYVVVIKTLSLLPPLRPHNKGFKNRKYQSDHDFIEYHRKGRYVIVILFLTAYPLTYACIKLLEPDEQVVDIYTVLNIQYDKWE